MKAAATIAKYQPGLYQVAFIDSIGLARSGE